MQDARFKQGLLALVVVATVVRVAYVLAQPGSDPAFDRPMLDGAYYWEWARALARGEAGPGGAFYLAPLYPFLQALVIRLAGESFQVLYLIQHGMVVAAAVLLAVGVRASCGNASALAAAVLVLTYQPVLFFSSQPVSEALALLLLGAAMAVGVGAERRLPTVVAGTLAGLASLARPNLLLVPALWAVGDVAKRRPVRGVLLVVGVALVITPVLLRNLAVSGHPVPISANAGMTLYHGNGPGAEGVGLLPPEFSGTVLTQREEATRIAVLREGRAMDDVEADRWWGREAVRVRLADPAGSAWLGLRRVALSLANAELSLDYTPSLDGNPWRFAAPVSFAVLLGLAAAGIALAGFSGTGGARIWLAIVATVATPVLFYVSSRYRLPTAFLLCVPAGVGVTQLLAFAGDRAREARWPPWRGIVAFVVVVALSLAIPAGGLVSRGEATALANRAVSWTQRGDVGAAERDLRSALALEPQSVAAWFGLGRLQETTGRTAEAEASYRRALELRPASAEAAGNLGRILIGSGRAGEAVPLLLKALESRPLHEVCWTNLVVALYSVGDFRGARSAVEQALSRGVALAPDLVATVRSGPPATDPRSDPGGTP